MTPFLQLALALATILAAARIGGFLSFRLGQPAVLGELLVGVILGPSLVNLLHLPIFTDQHLAEVIAQFGELGVLLLMFIAGLDLHLSELAKSGKTAAFSGLLGVIFPLGLGWGLGLLFSMSMPRALFLGLVLSATSVSISVQTLIELNALRSRVGMALLGAAVFDDILVILGLSIFNAVELAQSGASVLGILGIILRMALFLGIGAGLGFLLIPRLTRRVSSLPISQGLVTFTIVCLLLYSWSAEQLGNMAAITGAFLAGLVFARSPLKERIQTSLSTMAYGLFVPVFFVDVGLKADARQLFGSVFWLFVLLAVAALVSKLLGAGLGAWATGFTRREALQLGLGMTSRGEVGLIVASAGVAEGFLNGDVFAAVVGMVILTTLITPPLLRLAFSNPPPNSGKSFSRSSEQTTGE